MRQRRLGAEHMLVEIVERGEADREEFAEDDALGNAVGHPEAQLHRQAAQAGVDLLLVARGDVGHAVAHDDPVEDRIIRLAALAPSVAHRGRILRMLDDLVADRIDAGEHVEIDKAVVHRRDQRVGDAMRQPVEERVGARRVDHHEIVAGLDVGEAFGEAAELFAFGIDHRFTLRRRHMEMLRQRQRDAGAARPAPAILDIAGQR